VWGKIPVPDGSPQGARTVLVRPDGVRLTDATQGLRCTVGARTFRGSHVAVLLRPDDGPELEAECSLLQAPAEGDTVGVVFAADDVVVLGTDGPDGP
jgi:thiamine transport system ATP-binding protein